MPTYDYVCNSCEHAFELFQAMSARVKRKCPECGERSLERLIGTGSAVIFKGSGFYETDYRSDSYKKAAEADGKAGKADTTKDSSSKSEKSTESGSKSKSEAASKKTETKSNTATKSASASQSKTQES